MPEAGNDTYLGAMAEPYRWGQIEQRDNMRLGDSCGVTHPVAREAVDGRNDGDGMWVAWCRCTTCGYEWVEDEQADSWHQ